MQYLSSGIGGYDDMTRDKAYNVMTQLEILQQFKAAMNIEAKATGTISHKTIEALSTLLETVLTDADLAAMVELVKAQYVTMDNVVPLRKVA